MTQSYEWSNPWAENFVPQNAEFEASGASASASESGVVTGQEALLGDFTEFTEGEGPFSTNETSWGRATAVGEDAQPGTVSEAFEHVTGAAAFERPFESGEYSLESGPWPSNETYNSEATSPFGMTEQEDLFEAYPVCATESSESAFSAEAYPTSEATYGEGEVVGNCAEMLHESLEELSDHEDGFQGLTELERKALTVVSTFETGRRGSFGGLAGDFDGQGISFGLMNWNIKSGGLAEMLKEFALRHATRFSAVFAPDADRFKQILLATVPAAGGRVRDVSGQLAFVRSVMLDAHRRVNDRWRAHFGRLEQDAVFRGIQVRWAKKGLDAAKAWCQKLGFVTERGFAFLFDVVTQFGQWWLNAPQFRGARERMLTERLRRRRAELGRDLREVERMAVIAQMLVDLAKPEFRNVVRSRKMWFVEGGGKIYGSGAHVDLARDFGITDQPMNSSTAGVSAVAVVPSYPAVNVVATPAPVTSPVVVAPPPPPSPAYSPSMVNAAPSGGMAPLTPLQVTTIATGIRTIRGRAVSRTNSGTLEGASVYVSSKRFIVGRELRVFVNPDVRSTAVTRLPPGAYRVIQASQVDGGNEFTKIGWANVPLVPNGEGWICSRSGRERYAGWGLQRGRTPAAVCDASGAFSVVLPAADGDCQLRIVKPGYLDGEVWVPAGDTMTVADTFMSAARTVSESTILKWLAVYRGYGYSLKGARYPQECFDANRRLGVYLNRDLALVRNNNEKYTNCSTFTSGLLVPSWATALGSNFRWTLRDHNRWNLAGKDISLETRTEALNGPVEQGMAELYHRVDDSRVTTNLGAELAPTRWSLVQGFRSGLGGHSFIILDYDPETDRVLLLEANALGQNAAFKIDYNPPPSGPMLRGIGHIDSLMPGTSEFPLGTQWRLRPNLTTWQQLKASYPTRIMVRLFVNDLSWFA